MFIWIKIYADIEIKVDLEIKALDLTLNTLDVAFRTIITIVSILIIALVGVKLN